MNILLLHQYFLEKDDPGGSRFNEMTKIWEAEGNTVDILCGMVHYAGSGKPAKYKKKYIIKDSYSKGITAIRCHVSDSYNTNFIGRLWAYFSFVISSIIAGLFYTTKKYDIILVTSPPLFIGITAYFLSKIKNIPFVFEIRDLWPESAIDTGVLKNKTIIKFAFWFENFMYKKAILINVLTKAFEKNLIENKNVNPEKIIYIPNGADFSLSEKLLTEFNIQKFRDDHNFNNRFVITYVGAHGVANHLFQVIETAELLRENTKVLFLLIGDGMQKEWLKSEVIKRELSNIVFIDSVPKAEVFKYILASDFGSSILKKVDTFKTVLSNKSFDYMACKKPIFMLIDGVSRELVEDANCGVYVEPENPQMFKKEIEKQIELGNVHWDILGNNGYTFAKQNFDREFLAKEYLYHIQKLVNV